MRMNLIARSAEVPRPGFGTIPVSLTLRPAGGLPGDYQFSTDSGALLKLLRQYTDLSLPVLKKFETELLANVRSQVLGVDLSIPVLTQMGYFID